MTKFKLQARRTTKIKYWKASGSSNPPSLIHALWNIGILIHKQATRAKHFGPECTYSKYPVSIESRLQISRVANIL